ncbi:MAG TPA: twin-arginine translocation pathway signal protein [Epsilonproteobacteria bacterium]|nr:twin-arginine translocation pathway signal protein [Campylobacterota bacterium]
MTRREMMKIAATTALASTVASAYDEKLIVNKEKMTPKDPKNMTKAELKHTPEITLGSKDAAGYTLVEVSVGQGGIIHPSTDNHWIYEIILFADGKQVDSVALEPTVSRGYLGTRVKLDGVKEVSAIAKCNLHGDWTSTKALNV